MTRVEANEKLIVDFVVPVVDGSWAAGKKCRRTQHTVKTVPVGLSTTTSWEVEIDKEIVDLLEAANVSQYGGTYVSMRRDGVKGPRDFSIYITIRLKNEWTAELTVKETVKRLTV